MNRDEYVPLSRRSFLSALGVLAAGLVWSFKTVGRAIKGPLLLFCSNPDHSAEPLALTWNSTGVPATFDACQMLQTVNGKPFLGRAAGTLFFSDFSWERKFGGASGTETWIACRAEFRPMSNPAQHGIPEVKLLAVYAEKDFGFLLKGGSEIKVNGKGLT